MLKIRDMAARSDLLSGGLRVSPSRRIIAGPRAEVSLEPRVMQVLLLLLDAQGAVVTRDQLFDECWGGAMVGDDSINRAIGRLRRALFEVAPGDFEIETIPRTGYRLVPTAPAGDATRVRVSAPQGTHTSEATVSRRLVIGGGLGASLAAGFGIWQWGSPPKDPAAALIEESRIAVRSGTKESAREAAGLLRRAIALSPNNADAWGALALTLAQSEEQSTAATEAPTSDLERAARRALQLDSRNADAKAALAIAIPYYGDWLSGERRFDAVLAQHPRHSATLDARAFLHAATGRVRESSETRLKFLSSEPFDAKLQYRQIYAHWMLGRIAEADQVSSRAMEMFPRHPGVWFGRLWLLSDTGRFDRALALIDDPYARPKLPPQMVATLRTGLKAAQSQDQAQVKAAVEQVMAGVARSLAGVVNAMMLLNLMRATDAAFDLAEAYYLERGPVIAAMQWRPGQPRVPDQRGRKTNMLFTPNAAVMQQDPRFLPLMERMGLADYWRRRGVRPDFLTSAIVAGTTGR